MILELTFISLSNLAKSNKPIQQKRRARERKRAKHWIEDEFLQGGAGAQEEKIGSKEKEKEKEKKKLEDGAMPVMETQQTTGSDKKKKK
ncbi:unnamed protein product [Strongylus vulgaris]|uniref:Uncharacterized protein n=1 Tax=Strongylus vulgaris TaxID=40348 RepID=A0A3P7KZ57_STRVU|nr:unnamed protein product [Strongylus vulgaris]